MLLQQNRFSQWEERYKKNCDITKVKVKKEYSEIHHTV